MKKYIYIIVALLLGFSFCSCSNSPVGTYYTNMEDVDMIVLRPNGSATITHTSETFDTYWDYAGKGIDVSIKLSQGFRYWMDFDEMMIYFGVDDYRSSKNGRSFRKAK